jgi:sortase A
VRNLKLGDPLVMTTADRVYRYRVNAIQIVEPTDVHVLNPTEHPTLTLVTCFPFEYIGNAPKRYIVSASLESEETRTVDPASR